MTWAYYNEIDRGAAAWLRNNMALGLIAPGEIDTRSIKDVDPDDLKAFTQCHFFAGIGGWSYAARLAGWGDDRPLWSGSCPCQPFSSAGKQGAASDPRHLWPDLHRLMRARRPVVAVGEQVSGALGRTWFHGVRSDLERSGYAARGVDVPACAVDAPHIRNRIYWVALADAAGDGRQQGIGAAAPARYRGEPAAEDGGRADEGMGHAEGEQRRAGLRQDGALGDRPVVADRDGDDRGEALGDAAGARLQGRTDAGGIAGGSPRRADAQRADGGSRGHGDLGDAERIGRGSRRHDHARDDGAVAGAAGQLGHNRPGRGFWAGAGWIVCADGKARRVADASASLLAHGVRGGVPVRLPDSFRVEGGEGLAAGPDGVRHISRVAAWSGFGNAIVADLAAEHLSAILETCPV